MEPYEGYANMPLSRCIVLSNTPMGTNDLKPPNIFNTHTLWRV